MKNLEDRIKRLKDAVNEQGEVTITAVTAPGELKAYQAKKASDQRYKNVKLKAETYHRLQGIIDQHGLITIGRLVDQLVNDWCDKYESGTY